MSHQTDTEKLTPGFFYVHEIKDLLKYNSSSLGRPSRDDPSVGVTPQGKNLNLDFIF
jgi:hypothetical protein